MDSFDPPHPPKSDLTGSDAPPSTPGVTPMMEFFQRRVEKLERELDAERQRATAALNMVSQQEALRAEVDAHLKAMTDQVRREKASREIEEARSRADGRVEALEKRLDEMNSTFASLLKDAIAARPAESQSLSEAVGRRVEELGARFTRESVELARTFEAQTRAMREEQFKERASRDAEISRRVAELGAQLATVSAEQTGAAAASDGLRAGLDRVVSMLTATPKAKDVVIEELKREKDELLKLLYERSDALRDYSTQRRAVEKSLSDELVALGNTLEDERARTRAAQALADKRVGEVEGLQARLDDSGRALAERDERFRSLSLQRDELERALAAEQERTRQTILDRRTSEAAAAQDLLAAKRLAEEEAARRVAAEGAAADARLQINALALQTARTLQERDATLARFSDWEKERQRLLETVRKKDEMIAVFTSSFTGALKKSA